MCCKILFRVVAVCVSSNIYSIELMVNDPCAGQVALLLQHKMCLQKQALDYMEYMKHFWNVELFFPQGMVTHVVKDQCLCFPQFACRDQVRSLGKGVKSNALSYFLSCTLLRSSSGYLLLTLLFYNSFIWCHVEIFG